MKIKSFLVGQPTNKIIVQKTSDNRLDLLLREQRLQRSDLKDIKLMINKLLINEHLQKQVDEYFTEQAESNTGILTEEAELHELEDK